jgi:hypothetical protein
VRRSLLVSALAVALSLSDASAGEEERADYLFRRLAAPSDPEHNASVKAWAALSPADRLARIRAGIRSQDPRVARLAAAVADPDALDLEEIHRAMAICASDAAWVANPTRPLFGTVASDGRGFGIPDMPAVCRTAATAPGFSFTVTERVVEGMLRTDDPSDEFHRAMEVSIAEPLIALLETRNSAVGHRIGHWLGVISVNTTRNETRPSFAKAFLYRRARSEAEAAGRPVRPLESFESNVGGAVGVPTAVEALLRRELADAKEDGSRAIHDPWLLRWLWDLSPVAEDLALLKEVANAAPSIRAYSVWAVRGLAALDTDGTKSDWRSLAQGEDWTAVAAAAELARRGAPERLRTLANAGDETAVIHAWETDAEDARRRWVEAAATARPSALLDLRPAARARYELEFGVRIRNEDVVALGKALIEGEAPKRGAAWFYGNVLPEAVTPEIGRAMAKRLGAISEDRRADEDPDAEDLPTTLACLEVRAPEVLREVLAGWVTRFTRGRRDDALRFLARIGDTRFVEPMLASWAEEGWLSDEHVLGRVRDPRVAAFLRRHAGDPLADLVHPACLALAVSLGLPDDVRWSLPPPERDAESRGRFEEARRHLLAGDGESALLALTRVAYLGSLRTPRALAHLRRVRAERLVATLPVYWEATVEAAVAGDVAARAEWRTFVREGRVRMLDGHVAKERLLVSDPETAVDWIPHLDANCCLGFHAWSALGTAFPTSPVEKIGPVMTQNRVAFERWHAAYRGTFVWSRILDGWVPGPRVR